MSIIAAAQAPSLFNTIVVGDSLVFWEGLAQNFPLDPQGTELARRRIKEPISLEEYKDEYREIWGEVFDFGDPWTHVLIKNLFRWDPEGAVAFNKRFESKDAFTQGYNCDELLPKISCPILLIQADPNVPGFTVLTDHEIERAQGLNPRTSTVRIEGEWHALGTDNWNVIPLVRAISLFIEAT